MLVKYLLPILAIVGVGFGVLAAVRSASTLLPAPMVSDPPTPPYTAFVAGAGVVESNTENVSIGTHVSGIVSRIYVKVGMQVNKDEPLFSIDDRAVIAALGSYEAAVKVAEAQFALAQYESDVGSTLVQKQVISREDATHRTYLAETARAQLGLARAQVSATKIDIERQTVRAPFDGQILQMKIHRGEYAPTGFVSPPIIFMGNNDPLHVRVDVDENEAWRVRHAAAAVGYLRGNSKIMAKLSFVRLEPYVVPKVSLTGAATERVDTRVLQVIYSLEAGEIPIQPGQQMDVYIEAAQFPPEKQ